MLWLVLLRLRLCRLPAFPGLAVELSRGVEAMLCVSSGHSLEVLLELALGLGQACAQSISSVTTRRSGIKRLLVLQVKGLRLCRAAACGSSEVGALFRDGLQLIQIQRNSKNPCSMAGHPVGGRLQR